MQLCEEYRPREWCDLIGQDKTVRKVSALRRRGLGGRAYWISGASGIGKTSLAYLIARELADDMNIQELDASSLTPARLRDIEADTFTLGLGARSGRVYMVNEAHGLRRDTVRQLLITLERIPAHVAWIFTTTRDGQLSLLADKEDAGPLLSRCVDLPLTNQGLRQVFAKRVREIAQAEDLDGQDFNRYLRLAKDTHNNMRAMLQAVEAGDLLP